jgi:hypothetical protein
VRVDSAKDARPAEPCATTDLVDGIDGRRLDEVKAGLVVREERRPDVSDIGAVA